MPNSKTCLAVLLTINAVGFSLSGNTRAIQVRGISSYPAPALLLLNLKAFTWSSFAGSVAAGAVSGAVAGFVTGGFAGATTGAAVGAVAGAVGNIASQEVGRQAGGGDPGITRRLTRPKDGIAFPSMALDKPVLDERLRDPL